MKLCGLSSLVILSQPSPSLALASVASSSLIANKDPTPVNATTRFANRVGLKSLVQVNFKTFCNKEVWLTELLQLRAPQRTFRLPHPRYRSQRHILRIRAIYYPQRICGLLLHDRSHPRRHFPRIFLAHQLWSRLPSQLCGVCGPLH